MTAVSGRNGLVYTGASPNQHALVLIKEWDLEVTMDTEEVTAFGNNGWKSRMYMMSDWTATISGFWDMTDLTDVGQQDIMNMLLGQTTGLENIPISLDLYTDYVDGDTTQINHYHGDNAFVKNLTVKAAANGVVEVEFQLEGHGEVEFVAGE